MLVAVPNAASWYTLELLGFVADVSKARLAGSPLVPLTKENEPTPPIDCLTIVTRGNRWFVKLQVKVSPGKAVTVTDGSATVPTVAPRAFTQTTPVSTHPDGGVFSVIVTVRLVTPSVKGTENVAEPTPLLVVIAGAGSIALPEPVVVNPKVWSPPILVFITVT